MIDKTSRTVRTMALNFVVGEFRKCTDGKSFFKRELRRNQRRNSKRVISHELECNPSKTEINQFVDESEWAEQRAKEWDMVHFLVPNECNCVACDLERDSDYFDYLYELWKSGS